MKTLTRRICLAVLLFLPPALQAQTPDLEEVLDRLVVAYGGEENLRKMDSMVQEWDMVAMMSKKHGSDIRGIEAPDRLMVKLTYPDKVERRMLSGNEGLVAFNNDHLSMASDAQRDAMRLQLMRLYSPLMLREKADALTLKIEGDLCALSLTEHGVQADYLVDIETWRIGKVVGTLVIHGQSMKFLTEYSDFAFVEDVLVHRKENKYAGNVNTAMLSLRNVTFDADLDGSGIIAD